MTPLSMAEREFRLLVRWLIEGSRGGVTRARILSLLLNSPLNPHQIARKLGMNYRSVIHHLELLERNGIVQRIGRGYGAPYTLSETAVSYEEILRKSIKTILGEER